MIKSSGLMAETLIVNHNWRKDDAKLFSLGALHPIESGQPHIITQPQEVQVITHA